MRIGLYGKIIKGIGGFYYVEDRDGSVHECKARGAFRRESIKPVVGDEVEFGGGSIEKIFERRNELVRPPVSNIDCLLIVAAAKNPEPDFLLTDKLIASAESKNISPAICINKTDLAAAESIREIYSPTGYEIFEVSAERGEGIDALCGFLHGKVTAFAGLSGVGKSSLLNLLLKDTLQTGEVSRKLSRGRHTTRHVELFRLEGGGYVFDTPGFSSFELDGVASGELGGCFAEIRGCTGTCRFKGCSHISEPNCAVKEMLEKGKIFAERYESYKILYERLKLREKNQW